jgi:hypothetical protein
MWCEAVGDQRSARCGKRSVPSDPHRLRPGSSWEDPFRKGRPSTVGRHPASGWASCSHGRSLSWPARMSARTSSAGQRRIRAASPTQIGSPRTANCWTSDSFNLRALLRGPYTGRSPRPIIGRLPAVRGRGRLPSDRVLPHRPASNHGKCGSARHASRAPPASQAIEQARPLIRAAPNLRSAAIGATRRSAYTALTRKRQRGHGTAKQAFG